MEGADPEVEHPRPRHVRLVPIVGALVAVAALAFCVRALADAWPEVRHSIAHASPDELLGALACSAAAMTVLGFLWWRCLHVFGVSANVVAAVAWHFGGELGKYVPGGVWSVLGRGELARREGGIPRSTGYATTLISYACMSVAAAMVCGILAPIAAVRGAGLGAAWALLAFVPLGVAVVRPAVVSRVFALASRATRRRLDLRTPRWSAMLGLIGSAIPAWLLLGGAAVLVTDALGFDQEPARVAFAAVAAWLIGFLAVPVPAGAGVREVVFVLLSGLDSGPASAVAAITRVLLLLVDGVGGFAALAYVARVRSSA